MSELPARSPSRTLIQIDRSKPFNIKKYLREGLNIVEEGWGSFSAVGFDPNALQLVSMLKPSENSLMGEETLKRLRARNDLIGADPKIFEALWENKGFIPELLKRRTGSDVTYITFPSSIIYDLSGNRYVLCMCCIGNSWRRSLSPLWYDRRDNYKSAVFPNVT